MCGATMPGLEAGMRRLAVWLLLVSVAVFGQDLKKYVGTWEATFQGKPFFTLKLLN